MKTIKNLPNLSVAELFSVFNENEDYFTCDSDFYNHIYINTDGFKKKQLDYLLDDLTAFITTNIMINFFDTILSYAQLMELIMDSDEEIVAKLESLETDKKTYDSIMNRDNLIFTDIVSGICSLAPSKEICVYNNNTFKSLAYYERILYFQYIDTFGIEAIRYRDTLARIDKILKREVTFKQLFKEEFQEDIILLGFTQWLKKERYLNQDNEVSNDKTNFARVYYLLKENGIVKPNINYSKAMRTYFEEFGVKAVAKIDEFDDAPQVTLRTVTSEEARTTSTLGMIDKEVSTLLNIFKGGNSR